MARRSGIASRKRGFGGVVWLAMAALLAASPAALAVGPVLVSAVSRMSHGGTNFDVPLPQTAPYAIECRASGATGAATLVMTFDQNVTAGTATVTAGTATRANPTFNGATMSVGLTGITDNQQVTVTLGNVVGPGGTTASIPISFRILIGDVDGNGAISTHDITTVKVNINKSVAAGTLDGSNFRADVDLNGSIGTHDLTTIKLLVGNTSPAGPAFNTAPTISTVVDQAAYAGKASSPVGFTIGDAESAPTALVVTASSTDQTLIPNANIVFSGTGASRTFVITPLASVTGTCQVTLTVSDGLTTSGVTFNVVISLPPTLYLATLKPMPGVNSLGSGTATLSLSGDQTYAILKYSYSNLAGADSDDAVYIPSNQLVYDIPVAKTQGDQQPDGSFKWTFTTNPNANPNAAAIVSAIQSNVAFMTIESSAYAAGELQGTFQLVTGSQTFTAPADPPAITINPPSAADASRFMQQAAFGGTATEVLGLSNAGAANASTALNDWLTAQFAMQIPISPSYNAVANPQVDTYSSSSMYKQFFDRVCTAQAPNPYGDSLDDNRIHELWMKNAVTAPDQLRQRVATALSEIFVVSELDDNIDASNHLPALATYYDMLADNAFGRYYDPVTTNPCLLRDVTLHPIMGDYLTMLGNNYVAGQGPNENYAREVMQLFSIGLFMLQPDGTLQLDQNGTPIPTYDQPTITNFAHVFTGWSSGGTAVVWHTLISDGGSGAVVSDSSTNWVLPMTVTASKHSPLAKQLLTYPGAAVWPGQTTPGLIPANASQNTASANAELEFALANIFNHPNVGPYICKQLIQRLVGSNPSPAYVYRVAKLFANNGSGVRGDMKAVITAILTDYEARSTASNASVINSPGYGHTREPMIRIANILRSLNAVSKTTKWKVGKFDNTFNQTIFRSPTVFNFFNPTFVQPGTIQTNGLVSPEFDIIYETTITNVQNMIYSGIYATYITTAGATYGAPAASAGGGFKGDGDGSDIYIDFSTGTGNSLTNYAQTNGIDALIDRVGLLLMGAPMDGTMKTAIHNFVANTSNVGATDYLGQCKAVVHLVATSPACATQR